MKRILFLIILLTSTLIFNACSAASETKTAANSGVDRSVNANIQTAQNSAPPDTITSSEAEKRNREVFNNEGNTNTQANAEPVRNSKDNIYAGRTAPDDSTFNSTMNEKGQVIETRTFKSHPQLAKVERVFSSPKNIKIYVHLKAGKVVELSDEKLSNIQADSPEVILKAAGFQLAPPAPAPNSGVKKIEQKSAN